MINEIWKKIPNWPYEISTLGRVRNLRTGTFKKIDTKNRLYPSVSFWLNGKGKHFTIHRLLAEAFIPNPENKPQVNHIDGIKSNYSLSNLEWATSSENMQHAHKNNLITIHTGDAAKATKISDKDMVEVIKRINSGETHSSIAKDYGVTRSQISNISRKTRRSMMNTNITDEGWKRKKVPIPIVDQYGIVYNSITDAAIKCKASVGNVHSVLTGKRKSTKGRKFYFLKEET